METERENETFLPMLGLPSNTLMTKTKMEETASQGWSVRRMSSVKMLSTIQYDPHNR